ncbi:MAG: hypothetical protein ACYCST_05085 [Acidimicrobiales bacterium]
MVCSRQRRLLFLLPGAAALVLLSSVSLGVPVAAAATTSSVLKAAKLALSRQTGARLHDLSKSGLSSELVSADFGTKNGDESFLAGKSRVALRLTPAYGYLSGSASGLKAIFGLTAAEVKKIGKDWMSVKAGTTEYSALKTNLTISVLANVLPGVKGTTMSTKVTQGVHLYVLKWTTAATTSAPKFSTTMTISARTALPAEEITTTSTGSSTTTFSKWGEHVVVTAPPASSTISYTKVAG